MEEGSGVEVGPYEEIVRSDSHLNLMDARPPSPSTVSAFQTTICDPISKGRSDSTVLSTSVPWPALRHELAWEERAVVVSDRNGRASTTVTSQVGPKSDGSCFATITVTGSLR